ncbi:MAG: glycosyltransferase [Actinobacteria bacterium]|nr:glycosyltransferase [Actinomycetota bacterium]
MRILLTPFGSRGDVQPLLALGLELQARGHDVVVGAAASYRPWVEELGLAYGEIGGDALSWLAEQGAGKNVFALYRSLAAYMREELPLCFRQTALLVREADLVVTTLHLAAHSVAEAAGVPCRTILYSVQMLPAACHPPPGVPWQHLSPALNRPSWWAVARFFDLLFRGPVNRERAILGLPPVADFLAHARGRQPIVAADPVLSPLPADAPEGSRQTAALMLPESGNLAPELEDFLQARDPLVYIGFGSTPERTPEETGRLIVASLSACGARAVWCPGETTSPSALSGQIYAIEQAPHDLLFPRMAAVVHHGGAGTTATALRAGIPQILVPQLGDQFFHARRVRELGIGPVPIPRRRLDAPRLGAAIREAVQNLSMRARARAVAKQVRHADGAAMTVDLLLP